MIDSKGRPWPSAAQIRAARVGLGWTQRDLAKRAGVHFVTVCIYERDNNPRAHARSRTLAALRRALEIGGVKFIERSVRLPEKK